MGINECSPVVDKQCLGNENGNNGNQLKHSRVTINVMVITSMGIVTTLTPQKPLKKGGCLNTHLSETILYT